MITATTIIITLAALGMLAVLVTLLPDWLARALLAIAIVGSGATFYAGWVLGSRDAKMFLSGLDKGTDKVVRAGDKVANLRAAHVQRERTRQAATQRPAQPIALPDATRLEIVDVNPSTGEMIEL
jgi:hypothetical protein